MEKYAPIKENKKYKKIKYNNKAYSIYRNSDLIGLKHIQNVDYKKISNENSKNNKIKDMDYYNQLIHSMNEELNIKNNDNKLKELENDKQFLLEKNKEIEEQIKKLQNITKKVNYIHKKNNYYNYNNSQEVIPKMHYTFFNYDGNYNYSMDNPNNSIKYSNYSNISQDRNNYIQIEDDSLEFFLDKNKNEKSNLQLYEDINNYYNKNNGINNNIKRNISFSSRNIRQNNRISNYLNYIGKNKTFQRNKRSHESLRMNLRYNKFKEKENRIMKKANQNNKMIKGNNKNDINVQFELIKKIINELNSKNINKNNKNFLIDKINELQNDVDNKISSLEKKYNVDINKKLRKINKLENENIDLKKKVTKIKSIV